MTKVFNGKLFDTEVVFSFGTVTFNENGIADIEPHENAELVLGVPGFKIVDEELQEKIEKSLGKVEDATDPEIAKRNALSTEPILPPGLILPEEDEEDTEEVAEASEKMSHAELDALAEEVGLEKYPKGTNTKSEKADAINEFIASK